MMKLKTEAKKTDLRKLLMNMSTKKENKTAVMDLMTGTVMRMKKMVVMENRRDSKRLMLRPDEIFHIFCKNAKIKNQLNMIILISIKFNILIIF